MGNLQGMSPQQKKEHVIAYLKENPTHIVKWKGESRELPNTYNSVMADLELAIRAGK